MCEAVIGYVLFRGLSSIGGSGLGPGGVSSGYIGTYTSPQSVYTSGQSSYASGSAARQSGYHDLYGNRTQVSFFGNTDAVVILHSGYCAVIMTEHTDVGRESACRPLLSSATVTI